MRRYLHALVEVGVALDELLRLEDCFAIERARAAMNWIMVNRHAGKDCLDLYNSARWVRTIATVRCGQPPQPFDDLVDDFADENIFKRSAARLEGLVLLANPKVRAKLFAVAERVLDDYEPKEILQYHQAVRVEAAFALQIAWATGTAPSGLVDFLWGKDVRFSGDGWLEIHTGNDKWLRAPEIVSRLASLYYLKARPRLYRFESRLTFPGHRKGSKKNPISLSRAISRVVAEKSGQRLIAIQVLQALIASNDLEDETTREMLMQNFGYRTPSAIEQVRRVLTKKLIQNEQAKKIAGGRHGIRALSVATSG